MSATENLPPTDVTDRPSSPPTKSASRQRLEKLQLLARVQLTPDEYRLYGFEHRDRDYRSMLDYLSQADLWERVWPTVNDPAWFPVLDNKLFFHLHYGGLGLPLPRLYGVYDPTWGFDLTGRPLTSAAALRDLLQAERPRRLVVKPLGGMLGRGILVLDEIDYRGDEVEAVSNAGERLSIADLVERIKERPRPLRRGDRPVADLAGYLIQERVEQHPFFAAIAPYTPNTLRVVTFVDPDGEVDVHFTTVRLGRRGSTIDNWDQGGLSVGIDPATGELGEGIFKSTHGTGWVGVHPDSGVRFAGERVPGWDDLLATCRRAARLTPGLRWVGWDVALAPTGAVLIEGNSHWALPPMQMMRPNGFLQPDVRAKLARLGLDFPADRLPPVNLRRWRAMLRHPQLRAAVIPIPIRKTVHAVKGVRRRD